MIYDNLTFSQHSSLTNEDKAIIDRAAVLEARFRPQFEQHSFTYHHPKEELSYLPDSLKSDTNFYRDQDVEIGYSYWPAKKLTPQSKTIICLGGIYNSARRFDFFAEQASLNNNVICMDYPGKGQSGNLRLPNDYTLKTYAKIVENLIAEVVKDLPFSIVGHSHGAKVVYEMVDQGFTHPRWESFVIGDMPPQTPEAPKARRSWRNREVKIYPTISSSIASLGSFLKEHGAPLPMDFVIHEFNHGFHYLPREKGYTWNFDPNSMHGYCDEYKGPYDKWNAFLNLPVPILILTGDKSNTTEPALLQSMKDARPDASVFMFKDTGHYPELFTKYHIGEVENWITAQKIGKIGDPLFKMMPRSDEVPNQASYDFSTLSSSPTARTAVLAAS